MKISSATNFALVGSFCLDTNENTKKNLNFQYQNKSDPKLIEDVARVYAISVNGTIVKIGGSNAKGGIKGTISPYLSGNGGRPSDRTHGVNMFIEEELVSGKKVELHYITMPNIMANVPTLLGVEEKEVSTTYKPLEEACLGEYVSLEGTYPPWNFQESGNPWPIRVQESNQRLKSGARND